MLNIFFSRFYYNSFLSLSFCQDVAIATTYTDSFACILVIVITGLWLVCYICNILYFLKFICSRFFLNAHSLSFNIVCNVGKYGIMYLHTAGAKCLDTDVRYFLQSTINLERNVRINRPTIIDMRVHQD